MSLPTPNHPLLKCHDIVKTYDHTHAVDHVNFEVQHGELISILGSSGCGKTTLLHLISGFLDVDDGQIDIDGVCMSSKKGENCS